MQIGQFNEFIGDINMHLDSLSTITTWNQTINWDLRIRFVDFLIWCLQLQAEIKSFHLWKYPYLGQLGYKNSLKSKSSWKSKYGNLIALVEKNSESKTCWKSTNIVWQFTMQTNDKSNRTRFYQKNDYPHAKETQEVQ